MKPLPLTEFEIALVEKDMSPRIAQLAVCLTQEIIERTGIKHFDVDLAHATSLCEQYIENGQYHVLAARQGNTIIGFGALCESHSLYAEGSFAILQEFYVLPEYRSQNVGQALIDALVDYAKQQNWKRLELCTPPMPEFERTVAFYQDNGFDITGGFKMKRIL
ncbi:MAG: GNAT family N-acetyltransferase [Bermanella sp.]